MHDMFAVQLFSVDNLVTMCSANESAINLAEVEYMTPFVLWYAVVATGNLTRKVRLDLLQMVFRLFAKWYVIWSNLPAKKINDNTSATGGRISFAVEGLDVIRYMNSVIFLYPAIRDIDDVALNRIGTHPVENYFGMIRLSSIYDHSWDRFVSAAAKGILSDEIRAATGLKSHSRRDFSVGGVKACCQTDDTRKLSIYGLLEHGMNFFDLLDGNSLEDRSLVIRLWTEDLIVLSEWKRTGHAMRPYNPGPVASDTALSRIIRFDREPIPFKWTKRKLSKAVTSLDNAEMGYEDIANIIGCTSEDAQDSLDRQIQKNDGQTNRIDLDFPSRAEREPSKDLT
jgi:hypothetical protein